MKYGKRKRLARQTMMAAVMVAAALCMLIFLVFSQVFVVRNIMVVGSRTLSNDEVITYSGIRIGDNVMSISASKLKSSLEKNRYIVYEGHDFDYKGTLTLRIRERLGMAVANVLGYYYVMGEDGMVLECTGSEYPAAVAGPRVTGLQIDTNARVVVGQIMPVRDRGQLAEMERVLKVLEETDMLTGTSLLDLKILDNLYIMTSSGTKVELGDGRNLQLKLLIAREVLALRKDRGDLRGAKIDVSNGQNAHYIPAALPTVTPVPTTTPTPAPEETPQAQ